MSERAIDETLREYGAAIGAPDLALDENDFCVIGLGENAEVAVNIDFYEEDGVVVVYATVGDVPEDRRLETLQELLQANLFWEGTGGATLALDPSGDHALACASIEAEGLTAEVFAAFVERIARIAVAWAGRIAEIAAGDGATQDDAFEDVDDDAEAPRPAPGTFA